MAFAGTKQVLPGALQSAFKVRLRRREIRLQLGEGHVNRIESGVGRQEEETQAPFLLQQRGCLSAFINAEIIEDDDVARAERSGKLGREPCVGRRAIHRLVGIQGAVRSVAAPGRR